MGNMTPEEVALKKKRIQNPDNTFSTEKTITIQTDRGFINIPTIIDGKQLSPEDAIVEHKKSKVEPTFYKSQEEAVKSAKERSNAIGEADKRLRERLKMLKEK